MQIVKTIFWVLFAVIVVIFAVNNWVQSSILIWSDIRVDTKLPVLVIMAFLLGFLPTWLAFRATKWRMAQRIRVLEAEALQQKLEQPILAASPQQTNDPEAKDPKPAQAGPPEDRENISADSEPQMGVSS